MRGEVMSIEAKELAQRFGVRMCDENGDTHGEELYCLSIDDIRDLHQAIEQAQKQATANQFHPDYADEAINEMTLTIQKQAMRIEELEQAQKQEPVAIVDATWNDEGFVLVKRLVKNLPKGSHLYASPPQRQPLTDEQADQIIKGLRTCQHQTSKREFLKVWLRDWAAHGITGKQK